MGHSALRSRRSAVLLAVLAGVGLGVPATAAGSHHGASRKKAPSLPDCRKFSTVEIQKVIHGTDLLHFDAQLSHGACVFLGDITPGQYLASVEVWVQPGTKAKWRHFVKGFRHTSGCRGATFQLLSFANRKVALCDKQLTNDAPCPPNHKLKETGEPECAADPPLNVSGAVAFGKLKGSGVELIVQATASCQHGHGSLTGAAIVADAVLEGKLK